MVVGTSWASRVRTGVRRTRTIHSLNSIHASIFPFSSTQIECAPPRVNDAFIHRITLAAHIRWTRIRIEMKWKRLFWPKHENSASHTRKSKKFPIDQCRATNLHSINCISHSFPRSCGVNWIGLAACSQCAIEMYCIYCVRFAVAHERGSNGNNLFT